MLLKAVEGGRGLSSNYKDVAEAVLKRPRNILTRRFW